MGDSSRGTAVSFGIYVGVPYDGGLGPRLAIWVRCLSDLTDGEYSVRGCSSILVRRLDSFTSSPSSGASVSCRSFRSMRLVFAE